MPTSGSSSSHIGVSRPVLEAAAAMGKPSDKPGSRLRPTSPGRAFLLGLALLALLAVVAAASRVHDTPGGHAGIHRPPAAVGDYLFSIFALIMVGAVLALLYFWLSERSLLAERHQNQGGTAKALAVLLALALFAAIFVRVHGELRGQNASSSSPLTGKLPSTSTLAQRAGRVQGPEFKWLPVFLAGAGALVVLGLIGFRSLARSRRGLVEGFLLEQQFEELVEDTLADLYAEKDPRRAIIAAYARVERLFATYGLPRDPSEAPLEYLDRVLPALRASGSALRRLTALFEWAKFSAHDVDQPMRDQAIEALVAVRDELRANRLEAAA
jgi:NADH:ubiquinone oxidoreductase subunit 6 (subunit J)